MSFGKDKRQALSAAMFVCAYSILGVQLFVGDGAASLQLPEPSRQASEPPREKPTVKVAAIQYAPIFGEPEINRSALSDLITEAADEGAKIIVVPEAAIPGYLSADHKVNWHISGRPREAKFSGRDPKEVAEPVPGPSTDHFCALSKELGIYVAMTLIEYVGPIDEPKYFNTMCLISPSGELVAHYRKLNPYPPTEKSWATFGDRGIQTFDTEYGRVALAICFDIHTILVDYAPERPWALLFSSAWDWEEHPADWFWHDMPEKAAQYDHHIIAANWSADKPRSWRGYGFSEIISRDGVVLASAHSLIGSEIVYADLPTKPPRAAD